MGNVDHFVMLVAPVVVLQNFFGNSCGESFGVSGTIENADKGRV